MTVFAYPTGSIYGHRGDCHFSSVRDRRPQLILEGSMQFSQRLLLRHVQPLWQHADTEADGSQAMSLLGSPLR